MKTALLLSLVTTFFISTSSYSSTIRLYDEENRKKITQEILDNLINENYEGMRKDFHSALKENLPVEKLSETTRQIIATVGAFKKVISVTTATTNGFNQVRMRCQFEKDNLTLEATFNEEDKVIGLFLKP